MAAAPAGTKKPAIKVADDNAAVQKESMLSTGKAMSRAPIWSGMSRLPKAPITIGVMAQKIMIVPCMVKRTA